MICRRGDELRVRHFGATLAVLAVVCASLSCLRVSERFEDMQEAEREGFFEKGWLPAVLPKEAGPIVEIHDLDTNARCSRSEFPVQHAAVVETSLRQLGFGKHEGRLPALPFSGCPFSLEIAEDPDIVLTRKNLGQHEFAAILRSQGAMLFWAYTLSER